MAVLLYIFAFLVFYKLVTNSWNYIRCKRFLSQYEDWLKDPDWRLVEHKSEVVRLFKNADVSDSFKGVVRPLGLWQIGTSTVSCFQNFPIRDQQFVGNTLTMFHHAIGVYRSRIVETFNPLYWIGLALNLPRAVLQYLGLSPESVVIKVLQLAYWAVSGIFILLWAVYQPAVHGYVKRLVDSIIHLLSL